MIKKIIIPGLFALFFGAVFHASLQAQENRSSGEKYIDIQVVESPGGIQAWLVEDHTMPIIALRFAFKGVGAKLDPPEKQGLARMVSNTLDEGAGSYDSESFQKTLNDNSIALSFSASRDNFSGSLRTLTRNRALAFSLLKLAITEPRFDEDPVARMRAHNIARIRSSLSDPSWLAARLMNDIAFENHPYAMNSGGTISTLQAITPDDLRGFADRYFSRERLVVSAVGDITPDELTAMLDEVFGALPETADIPAIENFDVKNGGTITLYEKDIPQTIINIQQPGIGREDPDYYKAMVMNYILGGAGFGSRLMAELREERGLTYGVYSSLQDYEHVDLITINTSTKNESAAEALNLIKQEMEKLAAAPPEDEELARAKSYLIGSLPLSMTSTGQIAALLLGLQLDDLPADYFSKREKALRAITKEDVRETAQRLLQPDNLTTVIVGKPENVTVTKTVDRLPNVE